MIKARFNSTDYDLLNLPEISKASNQTVFSNIQIDFTGKTKADLPFKYQPIEIIDDTTTLLYAYVSEYNLPIFNGKQKKVILDLSLLSPQGYASKRTITGLFKGTTQYALINSILQSLVDDGFTIEVNNLGENEIQAQTFISKSIEKAMNELSKKYRFIWYIDELRKIYVKAIDSVNIEEPTLIITEDTNMLKSVEVKNEAVDYANIVNIKNVYIYDSRLDMLEVGTTTIDTIYNLKYAANISEIAMSKANTFYSGADIDGLTIVYDDSGSKISYVRYNQATETTTISSNIGYAGVDDDDNSKDFLLIRDEFFKTIIKGIQVKKVVTNMSVYSDTALVPRTIQIVDNLEISKNKGIISNSGKLETTIDGNGKYFTEEELVMFGRNYLSLNNRDLDEINLIFRADDSEFNSFDTLLTNLKIGSLLTLNLTNQFVDGNYIVIESQLNIDNFIKEIKVKLRSTNLIENYVDIFRKSENEENEEQINDLILIDFNQDENIIESQQVVINGVIQ